TTRPRRRGFGLATAHGLLYAYRGALCLQPGPERGAVARMYVPVAAGTPGPTPATDHRRTAEPAATPVAPTFQSAVVTGGERVLVVDDDPMILQFVSTTLERAGYRVQAVSNAADALRSYTTAHPEPFRLVLSDVAMPDVTGVDLARSLLSRDADVR